MLKRSTPIKKTNGTRNHALKYIIIPCLLRQIFIMLMLWGISDKRKWQTTKHPESYWESERWTTKEVHWILFVKKNRADLRSYRRLGDRTWLRSPVWVWHLQHSTTQKFIKPTGNWTIDLWNLLNISSSSFNRSCPTLTRPAHFSLLACCTEATRECSASSHRH